MQLLELETYINQSLYVKFGDENNKNGIFFLTLTAYHYSSIFCLFFR